MAVDGQVQTCAKSTQPTIYSLTFPRTDALAKSGQAGATLPETLSAESRSVWGPPQSSDPRRVRRGRPVGTRRSPLRRLLLLLSKTGPKSGSETRVRHVEELSIRMRLDSFRLRLTRLKGQRMTTWPKLRI